jgi:hypothetical protein
MSLVQFYRTFNFYCMVIAAESSTLSGLQSDADPAAITTALEINVTAIAAVASATATITSAKEA